MLLKHRITACSQAVDRVVVTAIDEHGHQQQLEADIKAGAVGLGEVSKALGLRIRKADGTRLKDVRVDTNGVIPSASPLAVRP